MSRLRLAVLFLLAWLIVALALMGRAKGYW